jgi:ubiquinone/menaquinone biosynthesis C-methylase UbiE
MNVGRTHNGVPLTDERWKRTIDYIASLIELKDRDSLIELCCGNGLLLGPLAYRCTNATGVDFSRLLLKQAHELFPDVFKTIHSNVLEVNLPTNSANAVLIYFAIQHFNQRDAIRLIKKASMLLKPGGRLLVGDVPDNRQLWQYLNTPEHRKDYIQRILECRPMIGTWFDREFFGAIGEFLGNVDVRIIQQPEFLINSKVRYDVLFTKYS